MKSFLILIYKKQGFDLSETKLEKEFLLFTYFRLHLYQSLLSFLSALSYLLWSHGTALLVVVGVPHGVPGVGVSGHGGGRRGPVAVVLGGCLHVAVVVTVGAEIGALAVLGLGGGSRELARVHARVPGVHQERTHRKNIFLSFTVFYVTSV